jgi:hypothetical protein
MVKPLLSGRFESRSPAQLTPYLGLHSAYSNRHCGRGGIAPPYGGAVGIQAPQFYKCRWRDATEPCSNPESFCHFVAGSANADGEGFAYRPPVRRYRLNQILPLYASKLTSN